MPTSATSITSTTAISPKLPTLPDIRPDHGRQLWEEGPGVCRPGYGKYDRALGIQYMLGVWDLLDRLAEEKK